MLMRNHKKPFQRRPAGERSTRPGSHLPVMLAEVLSVLAPKPGQIAADCTLGGGGHALELLKAVGPEGQLIGTDLDGANLPGVEEKLRETGFPYTLHQGNFAGLPAILAGAGVDVLVADLGMSSLQLDEPDRGFSYARDGVLDMRMNPTRGRTAADLLAVMPEAELADALRELGDEPEAERIAAAVVVARKKQPLQRTGELVQVIQEAVGQTEWQLHPSAGKWNLHPAARTFQALRILVNRELNNLDELLRVLPLCLRPGGRAAIISFHSGEDRRVKAAFRVGLQTGVYDAIAEEALRPGWEERQSNPRSRSAKLRWARRATGT
jgi:16S rRNA (cytosine1402-N4)-methyltransferase